MPIEVVTTIEDRSGDKATTSVHVLDASTIANLATFAPAWATALNLVIFGKIISMAAILRPSMGSLSNNTATSESDVEHVGKFVFRAQNGVRVECNIPALDEDAVAAYGSDELDQSDTNIAAFIAAMETGISVTGGTISPCDNGESSIALTVFAREAFKNSGKRR